MRQDIGTIRADTVALRADTVALRADNVTIHSDIAAIRQEGVETRRHFDIVAETMRKEIRIVAEGVMSIDEKLDRTAAELNGKIEETQTMIEFSNEQLRRRVSALEKK
ncbi:MAG: hypothetical protein QOK37_4673 [Thermoanaerobaculia bacterium]|nr:hypothetical protein [Thermoanaerobaculia bacterium]